MVGSAIVPKQYMTVYCLAMFIPPAVEHPSRTWVYPTAPGARFTVVYSKPVPIRELADELGVTMSFLHRKARDGKLPAFPVGDQTCVTPAVAQILKDWYATHRGKWWPKDGFTDPDEQPADTTPDPQ